MKKFIKKYGWPIVAIVLGGVVVYDHFTEISEGVKKAGKWIGDQCGSKEEESKSEAEPEPEPKPEQKPVNNRYERRPYQGGDREKYNNNKN